MKYRDFCVLVARNLRESGYRNRAGKKLDVRDVISVMDMFYMTMANHLIHGDEEDKVRIPGFGHFFVYRSTGAKKKRNPFTGKFYELKPRAYLKFRAYRKINQTIRDMDEERENAIRSTEGNAFLDDVAEDSDEE